MNGKAYTGEFVAKNLDEKGKTSVQINGREAKVFMTAGGIYTKADIAKNGNTFRRSNSRVFSGPTMTT
jgi:hypothetical protein